jgi:hypothetical protein
MATDRRESAIARASEAEPGRMTERGGFGFRVCAKAGEELRRRAEGMEFQAHEPGTMRKITREFDRREQGHQGLSAEAEGEPDAAAWRRVGCKAIGPAVDSRQR